MGWVLLLAAGCGRGGGSLRAPVLSFGGSGYHDGEFHMPREVGFSPDGRRLYILDRSHRLQVFAPDGRFLEVWPTPAGPLGNPRGLDVDPQGEIYVADTHNSQVLVYSPAGQLLRRWGRSGKRPGEFISVTGVAVDGAGNIWTCEYGGYNDRIQKFDPTGRVLLTRGTFGTRPGEFNRPQGITVGPDGRIYVADAVNHRVQILHPDGSFAAQWGRVGSAPGELRYPYEVEFDAQGRLYVAEFGNCRISVFDRRGRFLTCFGRPGRGPGEFDHPWGVSVAPGGDIYVSDTMNYRIQKFAPLRSD